MNVRNRLKGVVIALAVLFACFPIAFVLTILFAPFWSWLEKTTGFEVYGHSGPSDWCYWLAYLVLVSAATLAWLQISRRCAR